MGAVQEQCLQGDKLHSMLPCMNQFMPAHTQQQLEWLTTAYKIRVDMTPANQLWGVSLEALFSVDQLARGFNWELTLCCLVLAPFFCDEPEEPKGHPYLTYALALYNIGPLSCLR